MTFSIVGFDPETGDLGIAVASAVLAVGVDTTWAKAGVGAVVTQALANTTYGPRGLGLLAAGASPEEVIERLTAGDPESAHRQVGVVDAMGRAASFTGSACDPWAGGLAEANFACQGNVLVDAGTVDAMAEAFRSKRGDLATPLAVALDAGERAGGDRRGKQSAALLVVREGGGYIGLSDRYLDLRVDDHRSPVTELHRLLRLWRRDHGLPTPSE